MRNYLIKMETYLYILSSSEHNIYEDQILAILAGFGPEYDSVVAMITSVKIHILWKLFHLCCLLKNIWSNKIQPLLQKHSHLSIYLHKVPEETIKSFKEVGVETIAKVVVVAMARDALGGIQNQNYVENLGL